MLKHKIATLKAKGLIAPGRLRQIFRENYKAILLGGLITAGLAFVLRGTSFTIVNPSVVSWPVYVLLNVLGIVACWWALAYSFYKFPFYKTFAVLGVLFASAVAERMLDVSENAITVPLIILFWLGVGYLILTQFFIKYKVLILAVYGLIISYHFFLFGTTPNFADEHRASFASYMLIPIPVFAALWVYEQWRWLKMLKADKAKAELALLKSQVNPHFFFNTLNNLYGLVVEQSAQAPEVVLKLSDMMRYTIYEGKEDLVNLADEISYLEAYIDLHKIRYQKKVDIRFTHQAPPGMQVAPLLYIILLENAFKHGVERLTEDAYIYADLTVRDQQIMFTIENNYEPHAPDAKAGIGLDNLKQRLAYLYPSRHELTIEKTSATYTAKLNLMLA